MTYIMQLTNVNDSIHIALFLVLYFQAHLFFKDVEDPRVGFSQMCLSIFNWLS